MEFFNVLEVWLVEHPALVASVGVPVLTLIVTACVAYLTMRSQNKSQNLHRKLTHQLKLADFRQAWINEMRDDLAVYTALTWNAELNSGVESQREQLVTKARILMRMNPDDLDYEALKNSLKDPVAQPDEDRKALFEIGRKILKREWDRLNDDLKSVNDK